MTRLAKYSLTGAIDITGWDASSFTNSGLKWDGSNWIAMPSGGSGGGISQATADSRYVASGTRLNAISSQSISGGTIIGGLHYPYEWIIYTDTLSQSAPGLYYAKNGNTGAIYSDSDAATVIQYAIDQLHENSYWKGTIYIKPGRYMISSTIRIKNSGNVTLQGASAPDYGNWYNVAGYEPKGATTFEFADSIWPSGLLYVYKESRSGRLMAPVNIYDIKFRNGTTGPTKPYSGNALTLDYVMTPRIARCGFHGISGTAIVVHNEVYGPEFYRCMFQHCGHRGYTKYPGSDINMSSNNLHITDVKIKGCIFEAPKTWSVWTWNLEDCSVIDNYFEGASGSPTEGFLHAFMGKSPIAYNQFSDTTANSTAVGIQVGGTASRCQIFGNHIVGLHIGVDCDYVWPQIEHNYFQTCEKWGIEHSQYGGNIVGNAFYRCGDGGGTASGAIKVDVYDTVINDNYFYQCSGTAILLDSATNCTVIGNVISHGRTEYGIYENGACSDNIIVGNNLKSVSNKAITAGSDSIVRNNVGQEDNAWSFISSQTISGQLLNLHKSRDISGWDSSVFDNSGLKWDHASQKWVAMPSGGSGGGLSQSTADGLYKPSSIAYTQTDYIIYRDDNTYYARNGRTGVIDRQHVGDYGAYDVLNYAITQLSDGGKIYVLSGQYNITGHVLLDNDTWLQGNGLSTVMHTSGGRIGCVDKSNVRFSDFKISGIYGIDIHSQTYISGVQIENIEATVKSGGTVTEGFTRAVKGAFYLYTQGTAQRSKITNVNILNCRALECDTFGYSINSGYTRASGAVKNVVIDNCTAIKCGSTLQPWAGGFDIAEIPDVENIQVTNCIAEYCWESGFHIEAKPIKKNVIISNCISNYNGQKSDATYGAGFIGDTGVIIQNCYAVGNYRHGILYTSGAKILNCHIDGLKDGSNYTLSGICQLGSKGAPFVIKDSEIKNIKGTAIRLYNHSSGIITNNKIIDVDNRGIQDVVAGAWGGSIVSDNYIRNTGSQGITLRGDSLSIENNKILHTGDHGIWVYEDNNSIKNNFISGAGNDGIRLSAGSNSFVLDNIIQGSTNEAIDDDSTGTTIKRNIGYVTENSGWANIANGGTIAHGCASKPTNISVIPSGANPIMHSFTVDSTNITVYHSDAGNYDFSWRAEV